MWAIVRKERLDLLVNFTESLRKRTGCGSTNNAQSFGRDVLGRIHLQNGISTTSKAGVDSQDDVAL
jgi:hypothetical protein